MTTNVNVTRRYQCLLNAVEGIEDFHVLRNSSGSTAERDNKCSPRLRSMHVKGKEQIC